MRNFCLKFQNSRWSLRTAGYKVYGRNEYIKEEAGGRFHAKHIGKKRYVIHYDVYITKHHHTTFDMPITLKAERKRLIKIDKKSPLK
jgi:hypothetical protein